MGSDTSRVGLVADVDGVTDRLRRVNTSPAELVELGLHGDRRPFHVLRIVGVGVLLLLRSLTLAATRMTRSHHLCFSLLCP